MAPSRELQGRPAAPGIALGPLVRLSASIRHRLPTGDVARERLALEQAIAGAIDDLERLQTRAADADGIAMLDFQIEMLKDETLRAPALSAIADGVPAEAAWAAVLLAQVADYETADDDYFRARASDLRDIRDRVLGHLAGSGRDRLNAPGAVLAGEDIAPSVFLETDWSAGGGVALTGGSASSHVAMLARARGVPMVVCLGGIEFDGHEEILVDGEAGLVVLSPDAAARSSAARRRAAAARSARDDETLLGVPAATADGVPISVMINVADVAELTTLDPAHCDGIGLVRTEFLCGSAGALLDEEAQFSVYRRLIEWAVGRPVTIRTLDAGGDKPIPGFTIDGETNPFLGMRGIRLSLAHPEVLLVQLRALVRAAAHGPVKIMLPMVTVPRELETASRLLDQALREVEDRGVPARRPPLGIMVEVPATALDIASFDADFFSIGSNDLTQYVTASARDNGALVELSDPRNPGVMRLIAEVARYGADAGIQVSLCGDAGGDPTVIPSLIEAGVRVLSVAPPALARTKAAIASCRAGGADGQA
ncbi:MAG TPA: putative PEP-binding protein [Stellaceae bacterium]|jgi:phosphotransferase system enzyme I (PtsI)|nr:putative PEP-binding protein [Stellaceae bacterium]